MVVDRDDACLTEKQETEVAAESCREGIIENVQPVPEDATKSQVRTYVRMYQKRVSTFISGKDLSLFFELYIDVRENDRAMSLKDLGMRARMSYGTVRKIFEVLELEKPRAPERVYRERWPF